MVSLDGLGTGRTVVVRVRRVLGQRATVERRVEVVTADARGVGKVRVRILKSK